MIAQDRRIELFWWKSTGSCPTLVRCCQPALNCCLAQVGPVILRTTRGYPAWPLQQQLISLDEMFPSCLMCKVKIMGRPQIFLMFSTKDPNYQPTGRKEEFLFLSSHGEKKQFSLQNP